jgi:DNA-binding NtrC family response regulator
MALESWPREAQDRWAAELRGSSPRVARLYAIAGPLLAAAVERGEVRRDLWARISRFRLELPPLRARAADLPMLARRALDEIAEPLRSKRCTLDSAAIETLQRRRWSGNLPELREVIVQAVAFATGSRIDRAGIERAIEAVIAAREDSLASRRAEKESAERAELVRLLALHHGNVAEIARQLGLTRGAVTYRLRKYGLVR